MMTMPMMRDVFQVAYVTNDLEAAAWLMRDAYGWGEFLFMRDIPGSLTDIALAYSGATMIELMQPLAVAGDFYSDHLGQGEGLRIRHHHFGMLADTREDLAAIRAGHVALGNAIVLEGEVPGALDYLYADCRASLGHYLEYIRLDEGGRQMFAAVPGSPYA